MRNITFFTTLAVLAVLSATPAAGQCNPSYTAGSPGPDYVYLSGNAAMNSQSPTAVANAVGSWRNCYSHGTQMGFPIPSSTPVSNASYASITVKFVSGFNPLNDQTCGTFSGNTINVFQQAKTPTGATVQCSSFGYSFLIAHELGHFYGLSNVFTSGCTSIMGQADGAFHTVTSQDCTAAKDSVKTPSEDQPVNGSCQQPCVGTCSSDGTCQATTPVSPIVVALTGNRFTLSGLDDAVLFDIAVEGQPLSMGWTAGGGTTAFLALDLNGNGLIDDGGELFGNYTRLPDNSVAANGFVALSAYDSSALGGNGNLEIDAGDTIFSRLRLWLDNDHDGQTSHGELVPLDQYGITSISLDYRLDRRIDRYGNRFFLRGSATRVDEHGRNHPIIIYDVFFVHE